MNRWLSVVLVVLAGCDGEADGGVEDPGAQCAGGKCDSVAAPALERVTFTDVARCWSELDESTEDPFFQLDSVHCELSGADAAGVKVALAFAEIRFAANADAESLDAGAGATRISRFGPGDFPVSLRLTFMIEADARATGPLGRIEPRADSWRWGYERTFESREDLATIAENPWRMDLPFEAWPVVLWPSAEVQAAWNDQYSLRARADYRFDVPTSGALAVGGASALGTAAVTRDLYVRGRTHTAAQLGRHQQYFYAPSADFVIDVALGALGDDLEPNAQIAGPGYYVVGADRTLTRTAPDALPELSDAPAPGGDAGPLPDLGADAGLVDAAQPDAALPNAALPDAPDPCADACGADEACVAGACVIRANQRQFSCNSNPGATCDAGEDQDCAAGNVCVAGLCRLLECQTQHESCNANAFRPCEADAHCAEGHACAAGLCVRRTCQVQHESCNANAFRVCDPNENGDCGEGHACVNERCTRLSCQVQHESCNTNPFRDCAVDGHCADGHACVGGQCARLSCQTQHESCNTNPFRACDPGEDSDCAEGHVCNDDARCERVACQ